MSHARLFMFVQSLYEVLNLAGRAARAEWRPGNTTIITHTISTTLHYPAYHAATQALKSVVKPDWVDASITKGRLANPRQYSPDPRLFFSGLIVCCADIPSGDADAIIGGVLAMGGLYSSSVSKMVTHIVALTMDSDKCQTALSRDLKCKIVLPHWYKPLVFSR